MIIEQDTVYTTYCPYDGSKFGDGYFLYEFGPFWGNSCSALGFKKNVFLRPPINSVFSARQNWYIAKNGSERSFCLKNGDLWTKVEEQKWNFSMEIKKLGWELKAQKCNKNPENECIKKIFSKFFFSGLKCSSQSPDRFYTYEAISTDAINGWKFAPNLKNLAKISKKFSKKNFFFKNS